MQLPETRGVARALFVLVLVAYAYFYGGGGWNQNTQFDLTRAIVERHTLRIDGYAENSGDVSTYGAHVYSNKPPGISLLGVLPYAIAAAVERSCGLSLDAPRVMAVNLWIVTIVVCGGSGALLIALLYVYLVQRLALAPRDALMIVCTVAFATYVFSYSTLFFAHVPSALFLFFAFAWIEERPLLAGFSAGLSGLCFYFCIPAAVILIALLLRKRRALCLYLAGAVPTALALFGYQAFCYGSPFRVSTDSQNAVFQTQGAWRGVLLMPRLDVLAEITLLPRRGLFYLSPVLLLAFAGAVVMLRKRVMRRELAVITAIVLLFFVANAAFNGWHGGSAIGPRYVLPVVPLLAIPMAFVATRVKWLWMLLIAVSFAANLLAVAVDPMPDFGIRNPVIDYLLPVFLHGRVPDHCPWRTGAEVGHVSINPQAVDEYAPFSKHPVWTYESRFAAFNAGEWLAESSIWSLAPLAIWLIAGVLYLRRRTLEVTGHRLESPLQ